VSGSPTTREANTDTTSALSAQPHGPSAPSAVREPLAILHYEVDVMLSAGHRRGRERLDLFGVPMDLRHLRAVRERFAITGSSGQVSLDHLRISEAVSPLIGTQTPSGSPLAAGDSIGRAQG